MARERITISGHPNPDLNGAVEFHLPSTFESIRIESRMAALAAPSKFENLTPDGRAAVRLVATLEHIIDTAPRGFYQEDPSTGQPVLAIGALSEADAGIMWGIYTAFVEARERFREARAGLAFTTGDEPAGEGSVPSSEAPGARPTVRLGRAE